MYWFFIKAWEFKGTRDIIMKIGFSKDLLFTAALISVGTFAFMSGSTQAYAQNVVEEAAAEAVQNMDVQSISNQIAELQAAIAASNSPSETAALEEDLEVLEGQLPERQYVYEGDKGAFTGALKPQRVFNNVGRKHCTCKY